MPGQVGDRCNCEFWPSRVPTYPHSQLAARSAAIPTYPPSGAEFRERPPSGRAQRYLPTLARCLPAPRPYLPTLAQVFPIAAVTYLPGQRDATQWLHYCPSAWELFCALFPTPPTANRRWCRLWWRPARARARAAAPPHDARAPTGASACNTRRTLAARAP